jgi:hypothetical protein
LAALFARGDTSTLTSLAAVPLGASPVVNQVGGEASSTQIASGL